MQCTEIVRFVSNYVGTREAKYYFFLDSNSKIYLMYFNTHENKTPRKFSVIFFQGSEAARQPPVNMTITPSKIFKESNRV